MSLRKMSAAVLLLAAVLSSVPAEAQTRKERLHDHLFTLADDSMNGRNAGSADAARAAEYIIAQYEQAGLKPMFPEGWLMPFQNGSFKNVVGMIEGSDPELRNEYIVLGAHYDHLGVRRGVVYNGADDNASGTAALIEVARHLIEVRDQLKRSVIIASFDAEELGLFGSRALAAKLDTLVGASSIKLMMSIDMVGWLEAGKALTLEGVATIRDGKRLIESEAALVQLPVKGKRFENSIFTATDTEAFAMKHVPTLAVTTGTKSPYHKPEDDPELIDYEGLDKITDYLGNLTVRYASDPSLEGSGRVARKHSGTVRPVMLSAVAGLGSSYLDFNDAGFTTKPAFSCEAGALLRVNTSWRGVFGIESGCLFECANSFFPDEENLYGSRLVDKRQSLVVPVRAIFHTPAQLQGGNAYTGGGLYAGIGAYASFPVSESICSGKVLSAKPVDRTFTPFRGNEYGIAISLGVEVGPVSFSLDARSSLSGVFSGSGMRADRSVTMAVFGYTF